ncbi:MAG: tetratricopeptide repeat protein [Rhodospirillaceae bacterium]
MPSPSRFLLVALVCVLSACSTSSKISDYLQARALSNEAQALIDEGRYEEALAKLDQVIAFGSIDEIDYTRRASAHGSLANYGAAIADLDRALELSPGNWRTQLLRGVFKQRLGQYAGAIADLEGVERLTPDAVLPMRRTAYLKLLAGQFDEAAVRYQRLRDIPGQSNTADLGQGMAMYLSGQWREASEAFGRALKESPDDSLAALWYVKSGLRAGIYVDRDLLTAALGGTEGDMTKALLADSEEVPEADPSTLRSRASRCERALFLGAVRIIKANGNGAREQFLAAKRECPRDSIEAAEAQAELDRLRDILPSG